jgi:hypothetical protein
MEHLENSGMGVFDNIWSNLLRILLQNTPLQHSYRCLEVPGWLEMTIPCIHEMNGLLFSRLGQVIMDLYNLY